MLDLNLIRRDPDYVKAGLAKRGYDADFTELLKWDEERRAILAENEGIKAERNKLNKQIPALRKQGQDTAPLLEQLKGMAERVKQLDEKQTELENAIEKFMLALPNLPADDVVAGGKEKTAWYTRSARSRTCPTRARTTSSCARAWA